MPDVSISMEKDVLKSNLETKKSNFSTFISDIAESNFTMTSHLKLILIYSTLYFPEP